MSCNDSNTLLYLKIYFSLSTPTDFGLSTADDRFTASRILSLKISASKLLHNGSRLNIIHMELAQWRPGILDSGRNLSLLSFPTIFLCLSLPLMT